MQARKSLVMNKNCRVLYVSYNGALEEIVPSQVIPYLRELAKGGYDFTLLTFEKKQRLKEEGKCGVMKVKDEFKEIGIKWHWLRYHKRMPILATSVDIFLGAIYVSYFVVIRKIRIVHARSIVPATMCLIAKLFGAKLVFDTRGLLAEEYVGGGHWKEGDLKYRLVKFFERFCLQAADAIVVLTKRHRAYLLNLPWRRNRITRMPIEIIPCCVDLERFKYVPKANQPENRENPKGDFIFAYLGKIGKHYMLKEMLDFLKSAFEILPNSRFMIITQTNQQQILDIISRNRMDSERVIIKKPVYNQIPSLICNADAGIFFINPYKKFGSSPIKLGEFLGCGIPVIINNDIGDTEELVSSNRVGVVLREFSHNDYNRILLEFFELSKEPEALRKRCRKTAEEHLSLGMGVSRYDAIYKGVGRCIA